MESADGSENLLKLFDKYAGVTFSNFSRMFSLRSQNVFLSHENPCPSFFMAL